MTQRQHEKYLWGAATALTGTIDGTYRLIAIRDSRIENYFIFVSG